MTYKDEKNVWFYHHGLNKWSNVKVPKMTRDTVFQRFAENLTRYLNEEGELKAERAAHKAAKIAGVETETAMKYLNYLTEGGYINPLYAKVYMIKLGKGSLSGTKVQYQKVPERSKLWEILFPRLTSSSLFPRLAKGETLPRINDLLT